MFRLLRYLKPFLPQVLAIVALLFIQANADLALPDYMSRIVNVGIQQGGVEHVIPEALRRSTLEHISRFLTPEEQADLQGQYRLVDRSSPDYAAYLQKYPALDREPIYVLQSVEPAVLEKLRPAVARALFIVFGVEQLRAHPEQAQTWMPGWGGLDLSQLPPGTDLFALLSGLSDEQRAQLGASIDRRFSALGGERALLQAAARAVQAEYRALGMDMLQVQNTYILNVGGQMLLMTLVAAISTVTVGFLAARTAAGLARNLRHLFFARVMSFSGTELDRFSTASLITRSTNDITQIQSVMIFLLRMSFFAPLIGIGGIVRALGKSTSMWWTIALAVLVLVGMITLIFAITLPRFRLIQNLVDLLNRIARENLAGMMVVRAFNRQKYEEERFDRANRDLARTSHFVNRVSLLMMPGMMLLMNGLTVLIIWIGSHQVAQATLQVGDMIAFMQYAMQIVFAFSMLSMLFAMLPRVDVAAHRVVEVLETAGSIRDPEHPRPFPEPFEGSIEFCHVSFRYPGAEEYVLHDISFTIPAGQTVGIIGTTGSGKSTLVNLIPRFYDVTDGAVYIGGMDVRQVRLSDLREKIGYVPQQSNLFSGTVESNLRYADEEADEETMRLALEIAQAGDFVLSRPEGLAAKVSQGGANFSGGQKQRLSIARALVKQPPIYIFDDSFSSLDYKTDARLRRALRRYVAGSTVLIVSQRVATIKDADRILVLDEGRLIGQGTHEALLERCAVYREIALSQLKLQEVLV